MENPRSATNSAIHKARGCVLPLTGTVSRDCSPIHGLKDSFPFHKKMVPVKAG